MQESPGSCIVLLGPAFHPVNHRPYYILGSGDAKFKVYKVRFKLPVCISVSPVHSLTMELAINAVWYGLARLFDCASPGPRAACLWVPVQRVGPKVSRVIITWILNEI